MNEENKLKLAYSKIIPFSNFYAINLFGTVIRREKYRGTELSERTYNHELIHTLQAEDFVHNPNNKAFNRILGYCIFYILYFIEWLIRCILLILSCGFINKPYSNLSFEREAYINQYNSDYNIQRKPFSWVKYIFKSNK